MNANHERPTGRLTLVAEPTIIQELARRAAQAERTLSAEVRLALREHLAKEPRR